MLKSLKSEQIVALDFTSLRFVKSGDSTLCATSTDTVPAFLERVPMWRELGIKRVVCGAIPHTPDSNPFLGPATGLRNFWHCNGASIGFAYVEPGYAKPGSQFDIYLLGELRAASVLNEPVWDAGNQRLRG